MRCSEEILASFQMIVTICSSEVHYAVAQWVRKFEQLRAAVRDTGRDIILKNHHPLVERYTMATRDKGPPTQPTKQEKSNVALAYLYIAILVAVMSYFIYVSYTSGVFAPLAFYYSKYCTEKIFSHASSSKSVPVEPADDWFLQEERRIYGSLSELTEEKKIEILRSGKLFKNAYEMFQFVPLSGPTSSRSSMWKFIDHNTFSFIQLKQAIEKDHFAAEFSFHLNRITGGPITLDDANEFLIYGKALPKYSDEALSDLRQTHDAFNYAVFRAEELHLKQSISAAELLRTFAEISDRFTSSSSSSSQKLRQEKVPRSPQRILYPLPEEIESLLYELMNWIVEIREFAHPVYVSSLLLSNLIRIQPCHTFENTEKASQLLVSVVLMQRGYPPLVIHPEELSNYQSALRTSMLQNSHRDLVDVIVRHIAHQEQAFRRN